MGQYGPMPSYNDLIELARICQRQADLTDIASVAEELRRMADDYRQRAAALDREAPDSTRSAGKP
jgi:Tfp pilus assembly protein PilE